MNVFDLPGSEFLKLYLTCLGGAIALLILLRYLLRVPSDDPPAEMTLAPLEIAYLSRGRRGTVDAAIAALAQREAVKLTLDGTRARVMAVAPLPADATALEASVYKAAASSKDGMLLGPLRRAGADEAENVAQPLRRNDLLLSEGRFALVRFAPTLPLVLCLLAGAQKIVIGISRDRPVGFLVALCIVTLVVLLAALGNTPHRTRRGDKLLAKLRKAHASMKVTALEQMAPGDVAMAFGLFGAAVLAGGNQDLYRAMNAGTGSTSCGGGSCGSSSCGGGSCGGGCGGCGGD